MDISEITKAFFKATSDSLGTFNFYETKEGMIIPLKMIINIVKIYSDNEYQIQYATINGQGLPEINYYIVDEDECNIIKYLINVIDYNKGCNIKEDYIKACNMLK